jgi:hypothetical protein
MSGCLGFVRRESNLTIGEFYWKRDLVIRRIDIGRLVGRSVFGDEYALSHSNSSQDLSRTC